MNQNKTVILASLSALAIILSINYIYLNNQNNNEYNNTHIINIADETLNVSIPSLPNYFIFNTSYVNTTLNRTEKVINKINFTCIPTEFTLTYDNMISDYEKGKNEIKKKQYATALNYLIQSMSYAKNTQVYNLLQKNETIKNQIKIEILYNISSMRDKNNQFIVEYNLINKSSFRIDEGFDQLFPIENRLYVISSMLNQTDELVKLYEGETTQINKRPPETYLSGAAGLLIGIEIHLNEVEHLLNNIHEGSMSKNNISLEKCILLKNMIYNNITVSSQIIGNNTYGCVLLKNTENNLLNSERILNMGFYHLYYLELVKLNATLQAAYCFKNKSDPWIVTDYYDPMPEEVLASKKEYQRSLINILNEIDNLEKTGVNIKIMPELMENSYYYCSFGDSLLERCVSSKGINWHFSGYTSNLMYKIANITLLESCNSFFRFLNYNQ